jgi:hypothetical protein
VAPRVLRERNVEARKIDGQDKIHAFGECRLEAPPRLP